MQVAKRFESSYIWPLSPLLRIETIVRLSFLPIGLLTLAPILSAAPAQAGLIKYWNFDASRNRLDFKTDKGVQPKAVMLFNPTRLVVDLPGISFPKPTVTKKLSGYYRSLRVGQFDGGSARLVLELQPGYMLSPEKVKFTGENPIDWYVQIPVPERGNVPALYPRPKSTK
jgi:N-acetylmuramoyl-L-alanine amidase